MKVHLRNSVLKILHQKILKNGLSVHWDLPVNLNQSRRSAIPYQSYALLKCLRAIICLFNQKHSGKKAPPLITASSIGWIFSATSCFRM